MKHTPSVQGWPLHAPQAGVAVWDTLMQGESLVCVERQPWRCTNLSTQVAGRRAAACAIAVSEPASVQGEYFGWV